MVVVPSTTDDVIVVKYDVRLRISVGLGFRSVLVVVPVVVGGVRCLNETGGRRARHNMSRSVEVQF